MRWPPCWVLGALRADPQPRRRSDWMQRDRALILTALLAGLRADELLRANVGDLRRTDDSSPRSAMSTVSTRASFESSSATTTRSLY
jgi:hypothetical protein